jgi:acyl-coenzyme A synthetase/AMP-(fatty) acid ligase
MWYNITEGDLTFYTTQPQWLLWLWNSRFYVHQSFMVLIITEQSESDW